MKTLSQGWTARLRAAVDRYEVLDFDEPHRKRVRKAATKCARQYRMPRLRMACPLFPFLSDSTNRTSAT